MVIKDFVETLRLELAPSVHVDYYPVQDIVEDYSFPAQIGVLVRYIGTQYQTENLSRIVRPKQNFQKRIGILVYSTCPNGYDEKGFELMEQIDEILIQREELGFPQKVSDSLVDMDGIRFFYSIEYLVLGQQTWKSV